MNKGLLILEDGRVLSGKTSLSRNVFGKVDLSGGHATLNSDSDEFTFTLDDEHATHSGLLGKIVTDSLPIEYHMYDVKNAVT